MEASTPTLHYFKQVQINKPILTKAIQSHIDVYQRDTCFKPTPIGSLNDHAHDVYHALLVKIGGVKTFNDRTYIAVTQAKEYTRGISTLLQKSQLIDLQNNGIQAIIWREFSNYECQLRNGMQACVDAVEPYGITHAMVEQEWHQYLQHCINHDHF